MAFTSTTQMSTHRDYNGTTMRCVYLCIWVLGESQFSSISQSGKLLHSTHTQYLRSILTLMSCQKGEMRIKYSLVTQPFRSLLLLVR